MRHLHRQWFGLGVLVVCLLANIVLLSLFAPSAQAVLPPRPTVTAPSPNNGSNDSDGSSVVVPTVELLSLRVSPADQRYWSIVQWQDAQGRWNDVKGWRGDVTGGSIRWWVEERDFGKGPFRWLVFSHEGGTLLAMSHSFNLPTQSQPVGIYLNLAQRDWPSEPPRHKQGRHWRR